MAYNLLAVVLAALRGVHGEETVACDMSLYYIANEIATTYTGMMIAIPEPEWTVFETMSTNELATILLELAQRVRMKAIRKSPLRPKKPRPKREGGPKRGHVSTAKILMSQSGAASTP